MDSTSVVRAFPSISMVDRKTFKHFCLVRRYPILLLVLQASPQDDPEPQIIGAAIAAFQTNNRERETAGLPPLE